jgi:CheY-like chemotaxis protein
MIENLARVLYSTLRKRGIGLPGPGMAAQASRVLMSKRSIWSFLDLMMPYIDGFAVAETSRGNRRTYPHLDD